MANLKKGHVCVAPIGNSLRIRLVSGPRHAKQRLELQMFTKGDKGILAFFQCKSSLKRRIYAGNLKKLFDLCYEMMCVLL